MTDHFAVLGISRSPWLDADALKERFHRLSAQHHPDAPAGSDSAFTGINAAWQTLREPSKCLRHYLELEHADALATPAQTPPELTDLFMKIAAFREATQRFASRRAAASAPLTRALLEPERIALRTRLEDLTADVTCRTDEITAILHSGESTPANLATMLASLVFLGKWSAHLAEARLAF